MSLSSIGTDIRNAISEGQDWLTQVVETHLPAFAAEAERIECSPIYQEYAGIVLPPEVEAEIAVVVRSMVKLAGLVPAQPEPPVAPEPPAEPAGVSEPAEPAEPAA